MGPGELNVEHFSGTAAELHGLDPFADGPLDSPRVWLLDVVEPTLVLGSRQDASVVDADAVERDGIAVTKRRSGGGAVLLVPEAVVWIDVILPAGQVSDDVRASMRLVGGWWADALSAITPGLDRDGLVVHAGGMVGSPWSELVCFAGVGPGEVLLGGRKLVGLSQRRTRHGARVQGQLHRRSVVSETAGYLRGGPDESLVDAAALPDVDGAAVAARLAATLSS